MRTTKTFDLCKSGQNHLKSGAKTVEVWPKCVNNFTISMYML